MNLEDMLKEEDSCSMCGGRFVITLTDRLVKREGKVFDIVNVPCIQCAQCGDKLFNPETVEMLEKMVSSNFDTNAKLIELDYGDYE